MNEELKGLKELKELRDLRVRMVELAIDDLRKVADSLYVYEFLDEMLNMMEQAVIDDEDFREHSDYCEDHGIMRFMADASELDRLSEALANIENPSQEDEDIEEEIVLEDLEENEYYEEESELDRLSQALEGLQSHEGVSAEEPTEVYEDLSELFSDILGGNIKITIAEIEPLEETEELEERIRTNLKKSLEEKYKIEEMIEKAKEEVDYPEESELEKVIRFLEDLR